MDINVPESTYAYFKDNPSKFGEKSNNIAKLLYFGLAAFFLLLVFVPGIISFTGYVFSGIGFTIIFCIAAAFCALLGYAYGSYFYNKQSGGKISDFHLKKFDISVVEEHQIIEAFERGDFQFLSQVPSVDSGPLQMESYHDAKGKEIYCLIRRYFSTSDFRGITPVITVKEPEYSQLKKVIKKL